MTRREEDSQYCIRKMKTNIAKIDTKNKDIIHAKVNIVQTSFRIILVYLVVNDHSRNNNMQKEIEYILDKYENEPLVLFGDFNGHIGFLEPQEPNKNGERVIHFIVNKNLILLNGDSKCSREITWERGES